MSVDQREFYTSRLEKFGSGVRALDLKKATQVRRFRQSLKVLPKKFTILDVGCGFADFACFLRSHWRDFDFRYTGVEMLPEFIEEAKKNVRDEDELICGDFLDMDKDRSWDFVFCSGAVNLRYEDETQPFRIMRRMFDVADKAVICCMTSDSASDEAKTDNPWTRHFSAKEVLEFVESETKWFELDRSYMSNDITVVMWKDYNFDKGVVRDDS